MPVDFKVESHVAYITLNRPEAMNALDPEMLDQLKEIWTEVRENSDIRVAVLTGAGEKAFCTGTDMKAAPPPDQSMASIYLNKGMPIIPYMKMWKPIIAAIIGYAVGGGLEIALSCDMRIASKTAKFGLREVRVGSLAGLNGTVLLPRVIPHAVAMKLILTGNMIDAEEAYRVGLISDVVEPNELMDVAKKYAEQIAENAPLSVKAAKQAATLGMDMPTEHAILFNHLMWGILRDTEDRKEGFRAFVEKRKPQFKGK